MLQGPAGTLGSPDVVITDPPYNVGLDAGSGRSWDRFASNRAFASWTEGWMVAAARVLPEGALIAAFAARNTMHAVMWGAEAAGLEILDVPLWLYATGQVKHKAKLKPAYEPIIIARKPAAGVNARFAETGHGLLRAQDLKAEEGRHPLNLLGITAEDGADWGPDLTDFSRFLYVPKANQTDRDFGLEDQPVRDRTTELSGVTLRCTVCDARLERVSPKRLQAPCDVCQGPLRYSRGLSTASGQGRNPHPTVKPIALMRRLVRLLTPPGGTVLDPFFGSGTTGVAALLEGRSAVGIERDPDFAAVAQRRVDTVAARVLSSSPA